MFARGLLFDGVMPSLYKVSSMLAPFVGLPLSECNANGCAIGGVTFSVPINIASAFVISWAEEAFGNEGAMRCFLCTDVTLSAQTILTYYSNRWPIEVYFQQSKSKLAFGKYQVRSLESIKKYFALNALAYIFV